MADCADASCYTACAPPASTPEYSSLGGAQHCWNKCCLSAATATATARMPPSLLPPPPPAPALEPEGSNTVLVLVAIATLAALAALFGLAFVLGRRSVNTQVPTAEAIPLAAGFVRSDAPEPGESSPIVIGVPAAGHVAAPAKGGPPKPPKPPKPEQAHQGAAEQQRKLDRLGSPDGTTQRAHDSSAVAAPGDGASAPPLLEQD